MTVYMPSDSNIKLVKQKGTEDAITQHHSTYFINKNYGKGSWSKRHHAKTKKL
jgi:hypothetical protein